jgi:hypothetical protein
MASAEMRMWVRVRGQWRLRVASVLAPALPFRWRVAVARWAVRGMVMELRSAWCRERPSATATRESW